MPPFGDLNPIRTDLVMRLVCLREAGIHDVDYASLVMIAGDATAFAYAPQAFWIMYQPPDDPETTERRLVAWTGLGWEHLPRPKDAEAAWPMVVESVDAGRPLQAQYMDDYLFVGYEDAKEPTDRKVYTVGGWREPGWMSWREFTEWAKAFGRMSRPAARVGRGNERALVVDILRRTLAWAEGDARASVEWIPPAQYGLAGMEAFAADIADLAKPPDFWTDDWLGCHAINRQTTGRQCAAEFLDREARLFPQAVAESLLAAAQEYLTAFDDWEGFDRQLGRSRQDQDADLKLAWTDPKRRSAGAASVRSAVTHERRAVDHVRQALEALDTG